MTRHTSILLVLLILALAHLSFAQNSAEGASGSNRALLIGIDKYERGTPHAKPWRKPELLADLEDGANSVNKMNMVLHKVFGFQDQDVVTLTGEQPTHDRILSELDKLVADAEAGKLKTVVFMFSGHGGMIENHGTQKWGGYSNTILPVDCLLGAHDVTDKEMDARFTRIAAKASLTAIFDCCHSGDIGRGPRPKVTLKGAPDPDPDANAVVDEKDVSPLPYQNGALILSACEYWQTAGPDSGSKEGAFVHALANTLFEQPKIDLDTLLRVARSKIKANPDLDQDPVADCLPARLNKNLLGGSASMQPGLEVSRRQTFNDPPGVELDAGLGAGLRPGTLLRAWKDKSWVQVKVAAQPAPG